jgi:gas vesicle protein
MNSILAFILGVGVGSIITFFTIILFAETMDKKQKELYIGVARAKRSLKK